MLDRSGPAPSGCVLLFGYDELLLAALDATVGAGAEVAAVVFPSSRRSGPAGEIRSIVECRGHRVLEQPPGPRAGELTDLLESLAPDLGLVWSYPMLLPEAWLSLPRHGSVNVHFGVLPRYRGANGILSALLNDEERTGVTLHYLDAGIDTGPLIDLATFPIREDDDLITLLKKGRAAGALLLDLWLPRLLRRRVPSFPQDEELAGYYPRRTKADRRVDWNAGSVRIWNLVRSMPAPFPGALTSLRGREIILRKVRFVDDRAPHAAGRIYDVSSDGARVGTGDGGILVERMEVGERAFGPGDFARLGIGVGTRFEDP
ncbi:MAG: methionyl-tRNA formyltransferase [Gemmatimonadota bacterium]